MITEALDLDEIAERRVHDLDIDRLLARVRELEAALAEMTEQRDKALAGWGSVLETPRPSELATRAERERCIGILERHTTRTSADIVVNLDAVRRDIEEAE